MTTLYSAIYKSSYPFGTQFDKVVKAIYPDDLVEDGALVIWGGEDISPTLYGQEPNSYTGAGVIPSKRDTLEMNLAQRAIEKGMPIIGICRGAQLMCALSGGTVIQDVTGHHSSHSIMLKDGHEMRTSSLHHQMMNPFNAQHKMLAWSAPALSSHYLGERDEKLQMICEPEIVWFPETKSLAIQGHPEFIHSEQDVFVKLCKQLVEDFVK